jgi:hypothetical protein
MGAMRRYLVQTQQDICGGASRIDCQGGGEGEAALLIHTHCTWTPYHGCIPSEKETL